VTDVTDVRRKTVPQTSDCNRKRSVVSNYLDKVYRLFLEHSVNGGLQIDTNITRLKYGEC